MSKTVKLLARLLDSLRNEGDRTPEKVAELLGRDAFSRIAKEILGRERRTLGIQDSSDLSDCLVTALVEGLHSDSQDATAVVSEALLKNLQALAADAQRKWLVLIPVTADVVGCADVNDLLSTASEVRLVIESSVYFEGLPDAAIQKACQLLGIGPTLASPASSRFEPLFACVGAGPEDAVIRSAFDKLAVARDALRFALYTHSDAKNLGPLQQPDAHAALTKVWLMDCNPKTMLEKRLRNKDVVLGKVSELANSNTKDVYDRVARLLEMYPESPAKEDKEFAWRFARSIRIFSRATQQSNRDLRFLLLLVALEAVLNRSKGSPITEMMSDIGALVATSSVEARLQLAGDIRSAYGDRSQFVHQGKLPSDRLGDEGLAEVEGLIFRTWASVMRRLLPITEDHLTVDQVFQRFAMLKFGASWDDAFKSSGQAS